MEVRDAGASRIIKKRLDDHGRLLGGRGRGFFSLVAVL